MIVSSPSDEVLIERVGKAGVITLNRPQALNALTLSMIDHISAALERWEHDPYIAHVIIRQGQSRAFCAGGDIRTLAGQIKAGDFAGALAFYAREYRLNQRIKRYPKPYTALIDGIVMGGGVGVSIHGHYRVGSEKLAFAMPEVGIGLFPDVGGTYFLPRMPGRLGLYLALTGERIAIADALHAGVATHHVASAGLLGLFDELTGCDTPENVLAAHHSDPGAPSLATKADHLSALLAGNSLEDVFDTLARHASAGDTEADRLLALLSTRSPTSLALAFRQIVEGARLDFEACMRLEYRIVSRIIHGHDFSEGVRAVIIDKDNQPRWQPPTIAALDKVQIEAHLAPLPSGELDFP